MDNLQARLASDSVPYHHFHKTLPIHDNLKVDKTAWKAFRAACLDPNTTVATFEHILPGALPPNHEPRDQSDFNAGVNSKTVAPFVSPMAAWSQTDGLAPDPTKVFMPAPPSTTSKAMAAEMNELYWMASLRDVAFNTLAATVDANGAVADINKGYNDAITSDGTMLATLRDVPLSGGRASFDMNTLFRAGLPGELDGPPVSQFFLHSINYGAQIITPTQIPYAAGADYLTTLPTWLLAQNTGLDLFGNPYNRDNAANASVDFFEHGGTAANPVFTRQYIRNMRDLCRFVNRDALHQAYFNAALLLNNWGAALTVKNPVRMGATTRQGGFATLGGPDCLALVSWLACDAIRTVWHQKWRVWLRMRPEAFGGIAHIAPTQLGDAFVALKALDGRNQNPSAEAYLLPVAFSAGSPAHPSYGAGHACVAGACVTFLKAWFEGDTRFASLIGKNGIDPGVGFSEIKAAGLPMANGEPPKYDDTNGLGANLTVEGELNKLAANVAMGRSMGGVHFRTDNTRSLRLGEFVTTTFLCNFVKTYKENPTFAFNSFDGKKVEINAGGVSVSGVFMNAQQLLARYNSDGHI